MLGLEWFVAISIGAAGVPSPGISFLAIVEEAVGLPADKVGPICTVDWFYYTAPLEESVRRKVIILRCFIEAFISQ